MPSVAKLDASDARAVDTTYTTKCVGHAQNATELESRPTTELSGGGPLSNRLKPQRLPAVRWSDLLGDDFMKEAQEWNWEHTLICHNDPAVHGQLLPGPKFVQFIKRVQSDALEHAAMIAENYQQQIYRVDSKEAEAIRGVNCKIRAQVEKLQVT